MYIHGIGRSYTFSTISFFLLYFFRSINVETSSNVAPRRWRKKIKKKKKNNKVRKERKKKKEETRNRESKGTGQTRLRDAASACRERTKSMVSKLVGVEKMRRHVYRRVCNGLAQAPSVLSVVSNKLYTTLKRDVVAYLCSYIYLYIYIYIFLSLSLYLSISTYRIRYTTYRWLF